jgi:hypothetical protein
MTLEVVEEQDEDYDESKDFVLSEPEGPVKVVNHYKVRKGLI